MNDIGKLEYDKNGNPFKMINGRRIGQIKIDPNDTPEKREYDRKLNASINSHRASGNKTVDRRYNPNL